MTNIANIAKITSDYDGWGFQNSHSLAFSGFLYDVSIVETGLDWLFLVINWTKRKVLKDKASIYSNECN